MKNQTMSNFDPRIWSINLRKWIAYIPNSLKAAKDPSLSNESAVQKPDKKENVFQKIRDAYATVKPIQVISEEIIPGSEVIPSESEEEDNLETVDIEQLIEKSRGIRSAGQVVKDPAYFGKNVTRPEFSFMQNMEAIELEFAGIGKGPGKPYQYKNVTDPKNNFLQNLDAVSLDLTGEGTGPVDVQTENSYDPQKSLEENLMQSALDSEGSGRTVEMINENVTDPKRDIQENLDAISEAFPNVAAGTGKIKVEKKKTAGR